MQHELITATSRQMHKTRFIIKHMGAKMGTSKQNVNCPKMRKIAERGQMLMKVLREATVDQLVIGGVQVELVTPKKAAGDDIVIYIHGGGFTVGNARCSRAFASYLAVESGLRVYTLTYRLAPENPFPAGFDDCFEMYKGVCEKYPQSAVYLVGESAGGNLSIVVALRCINENIKPPIAICAYSPVTTLSEEFESHIKNIKTDIQVGKGMRDEVIRLYAKGNDLANPYISPLQADSLNGFPPTMLVTDIDEVLRDDSIMFAERLKQEKVPYELYLFKNTFHAFPITGIKAPESYDVLKKTIDFFGQYNSSKQTN